MGQLSDALRVASIQLTARLRHQLTAREGDGMAELLPQSWRFETESETAVIRLQADGQAVVAADVTEHPEVIVKWTHAELVRALQSGRSNETMREHPPNIRFTSDAGRKAFSLLGTSLAL